jgi:hypothetical protein
MDWSEAKKALKGISAYKSDIKCSRDKNLTSSEDKAGINKTDIQENSIKHAKKEAKLLPLKHIVLELQQAIKDGKPFINSKLKGRFYSYYSKLNNTEKEKSKEIVENFKRAYSHFSSIKKTQFKVKLKNNQKTCCEIIYQQLK